MGQTQSITESSLTSNTQFGFRNASAQSISVGKNRYHPRSPRMASSLFKTNNAKNVTATVADDEKKRKPAPPPPSKNGHAMKPDIISVDDPDDEEVVGVHDAIEYSYSDNGSIPEEVKRIALLQKKVNELESVLREYRIKEEMANQNDNDLLIETPNVMTPSMVPIEHYPLHNDDESVYQKTINPNTKGNIV